MKTSSRLNLVRMIALILASIDSISIFASLPMVHADSRDLLF